MRISDTGTVRTVRYATEDGGVHVGDDHFDVIIPNGYGDGFHEYKVWLDVSEWNAYEQTTLDAGAPGVGGPGRQRPLLGGRAGVRDRAGP